MNSPRLTAAVAACHTALASVPSEAPDNEMDFAVAAVASAVDLVCRIPAFTIEEAEAKLAMATSLVEWDALKQRLVQKAQGELATIRAQPV